MNERKEEFMDWAELYVLGGLDEAEALEYEAYLQQSADERRRVAELRDVVGMLPLAADPVLPPAGMKTRVLAGILGGAAGTQSAEKPARADGRTSGSAGLQGLDGGSLKGNRINDAYETPDADSEPRTESRIDDADGRPGVESGLPADGEAELLLEQAKLAAEADEARRAAQRRGTDAVHAGDAALLAAKPEADLAQPVRTGVADAEEARGADNGGADAMRNAGTRSDSVDAVRSESAGTRSGSADAVRSESAGIDARSEAAGRGADGGARTGAARNGARGGRGRGLWAGAAAVLAAAAVVLGVYSAQLRGEIDGMHADLTAMQERAADMEQQLALNAQPAIGAQVEQSVPLSGGENDPNASGMASMVKDGTGMHLVVQAQDLPALSGDEAYQIWLIKDGQPYNAGTFVSGSRSGGLSYAIQPDDYDMIAITLEPDAQGDQPRGRMVLTGAVNG
ncbi:anti-sigma factor [Saccharibacillus sp. CPCC 101409]|uniref:anti-sigma factor n=1 Tax=Saccharibacillus sp. CPCC 101409 TaxID=3058041 RepID=UPI002672A4DD|nr:anti-sigma factor [Saccharibacillus sp. CPCC 101409]MDO3408572.1 anti-sigma factor [Saccharibacillus sp. CPCC 101409]